MLGFQIFNCIKLYKSIYIFRDIWSSYWEVTKILSYEFDFSIEQNLNVMKLLVRLILGYAIEINLFFKIKSIERDINLEFFHFGILFHCEAIEIKKVVIGYLSH